MKELRSLLLVVSFILTLSLSFSGCRLFGHKSSHTFGTFPSLSVIEKVKDDKLATNQTKYPERRSSKNKKEESKLNQEEPKQEEVKQEKEDERKEERREADYPFPDKISEEYTSNGYRCKTRGVWSPGSTPKSKKCTLEDKNGVMICKETRGDGYKYTTECKLTDEERARRSERSYNIVNEEGYVILVQEKWSRENVGKKVPAYRVEDDGIEKIYKSVSENGVETTWTIKDRISKNADQTQESAHPELFDQYTKYYNNFTGENSGKNGLYRVTCDLKWNGENLNNPQPNRCDSKVDENGVYHCTQTFGAGEGPFAGYKRSCRFIPVRDSIPEIKCPGCDK